MIVMPDGARDCHAHVIGDPAVYPLWPGRSYDPPVASLEEYLDLLDRHGVERGVLVQPSVYGFDNRCMLDALDRADGRLLGVAVPAPDSNPRSLEAMHARGVRAVRCNLINPGGLDPEVVIGWQPVLRALGWHVEMHIEVAKIDDLRAMLSRFGVAVVIDHMGRPEPGMADPSQPGLRRLIELVREGACFVKLSAPYRLSDAPPPWRDVTPLARALLDADPSACLWATDWPHTQTDTDVDTRDLLDALSDWCPDARLRRVMMVEAPARLLGAA